MKQCNCFDEYPVGFVVAANLLQFSIFSVGSILVGMTGIIPLTLYVLFVLLLQVRLLAAGCVNCWYFGKRCFSGMGFVSSLFFKKGDPEKFINKKISPADLIPDMLVALIPLVIGIVFLVLRFNFVTLLLVVILTVLTFWGNGFVRKTVACPHCTQRELGCPAEKVFGGSCS